MLHGSRRKCPSPRVQRRQCPRSVPGWVGSVSGAAREAHPAESCTPKAFLRFPPCVSSDSHSVFSCRPQLRLEPHLHLRACQPPRLHTDYAVKGTGKYPCGEVRSSLCGSPASGGSGPALRQRIAQQRFCAEAGGEGHPARCSCDHSLSSSTLVLLVLPSQFPWPHGVF